MSFKTDDKTMSMITPMLSFYTPIDQVFFIIDWYRLWQPHSIRRSVRVTLNQYFLQPYNLHSHEGDQRILIEMSSFSLPTIITTPKRLLHGATTNLTPTVHPPCKASNPTASQNQQLLQLLRDCYMVQPQTLLLLYIHHAKLQILLLLRTNNYYNS